MGKRLPYMILYPDDWDNDTKHLSPEADGAWFTICRSLHRSDTRGRQTFTLEQWAHVVGYPPKRTWLLIQELITPTGPDCPGVASVEFPCGQPVCVTVDDTHRNGNVTDRNVKITLMSRRMLREEMKYKNNALRQKRFRNSKKITQL